MKHRLSTLLKGMEMSKAEHDWMEHRFENMTAKEEMLFQGAMQLEHPETVQEAMQILQGLDHYRLLYGADDDISLGRFVMEHIHTPTHAARGYLDPEIVGAAYPGWLLSLCHDAAKLSTQHRRTSSSAPLRRAGRSDPSLGCPAGDRRGRECHPPCSHQ